MTLEDRTTSALPRGVRVSARNSLILLNAREKTSHFVYTSLGDAGYHVGIVTDTPNAPMSDFYTRIESLVASREYLGLSEVHKLVNRRGEQRFMVVVSLDIDRPVLKDSDGRAVSRYTHTVVFDQRPTDVAQVREQVERMYLESTGASSLKEAIEQIHEQAQNVTLKRGGDTRALSILLEKLMAM